MRKRLHRAWDGFTLYLPVAIMGLLAMASWWLVRTVPAPKEESTPSAPRHEPDYFLTDFSIQSFDADGRLAQEIQGQQARHYPDTDTLEVDIAHMRALGVNGRNMQARAQRALSNADGSEVQLLGQAVVTRAAQRLPGGKSLPQLEFEGDFLQAWTGEERLRSHLPVTLTRGRDRMTADSLDYDNIAQVLELKGRVRVTLAPPQGAAQRKGR